VLNAARCRQAPWRRWSWSSAPRNIVSMMPMRCLIRVRQRRGASRFCFGRARTHGRLMAARRAHLQWRQARGWYEAGARRKLPPKNRPKESSPKNRPRNQHVRNPLPLLAIGVALLASPAAARELPSGLVYLRRRRPEHHPGHALCRHRQFHRRPTAGYDASEWCCAATSR